MGPDLVVIVIAYVSATIGYLMGRAVTYAKSDLDDAKKLKEQAMTNLYKAIKEVRND